MPDLPTITVTADQATRILQSFPPNPDTGETSQEVYRKWLKRQLRFKVLRDEEVALKEQQEVDRRAALAALEETLPQ